MLTIKTWCMEPLRVVRRSWPVHCRSPARNANRQMIVITEVTAQQFPQQDIVEFKKCCLTPWTMFEDSISGDLVEAKATIEKIQGIPIKLPGRDLIYFGFSGELAELIGFTSREFYVQSKELDGCRQRYMVLQHEHNTLRKMKWWKRWLWAMRLIKV